VGGGIPAHTLMVKLVSVVGDTVFIGKNMHN